MAATFNILGREFALDCAAHEQRRLEDLAHALDERLASFTGDPDAMRRLALAALSLMDETQAANAALARARMEIERLTDLLVDAKLAEQSAALTDDRGRLGVLRASKGAA